MPVFWLSPLDKNFPDPSLANRDGILAVGGDLSEERLLDAYTQGIFPWYNPGDEILWWCPNPRFVLFPSELKVSKSMRPYFNQQKFKVTYNADFRAVITHCQQSDYSSRGGGTWIGEDMLEAYCGLHQRGVAHSVEVWQDGDLVGGLYGVYLGKVFFGESMFARVANASKYGFITLVRDLAAVGCHLIDCQQETRHLESLGARSISRSVFLSLLKDNESEIKPGKDWQLKR
jgi:leucyl/phenylalanyl-tRNA--protein transferase